ncbi:hypothetical protein [Methyloglobulus sp.]|uniref:hypothetical protein n=1 Tax=Methyloglobulus sp. TaxID=2518622 RepID=UPI0032B82B69
MGELNFINFKRAMPHLYFIDQTIVVRISWFELVVYWINIVFGSLIAFFGWLLMAATFFSKEMNIVKTFSYLGLGMLFICVAIFMFYQTFSVTSAGNIET